MCISIKITTKVAWLVRDQVRRRRSFKEAEAEDSIIKRGDYNRRLIGGGDRRSHSK